MTKLYFLVASILFVALKAESQDAKYQAYAVGFYNVENLFDTTDNTVIKDEEFLPDGDRVWTAEKYKDKVANLASVISQLGLDLCQQGISVLGISEIENDTVLVDLVNHPLLRSRNYDYVHINSRDLRGIDVGLIYDKDVFTPLESGLKKVDLTALGGTRPTRDVLWVKGMLEEEEIIVTVNHWPSRSGGEKRTAEFRNEAARVNRVLIDSLLAEDPDAKIIVMGDMNDDPNNKSMTSYLRCKSKIKSTGADDMFNPYHQLYKNGLGTTAWRDRWSLFDQIAVSHGLINNKTNGLQYHKAVIFNKKFLIQPWGKYKGYPFRTFDGDEYQGGYSDHFPVFIYLIKQV